VTLNIKLNRIKNLKEKDTENSNISTLIFGLCNSFLSSLKDKMGAGRVAQVVQVQDPELIPQFHQKGKEKIKMVHAHSMYG
jgi:hypothetical protein